MVIISFVLLLATTLSVRSANTTISRLLRIQHEINRNKSIKRPYDQVTPGHVGFLSRYWEHWTGSLPVIVFEMPLQHNWHDRIGNFLGTYFDTISCAQNSGAHFVGYSNFNGKHWYVPHQKFWEGFPDIIEHKYPSKDVATAIEKVKTNCQCTAFCWQENHPWTKQIPLIQSLIRKAIYIYLSVKDKNGMLLEFKGLPLDSSKDIFKVSVTTILPIGPDVAVHFRCSDNLYGGMGLMSFGTIINRIPINAETIYVFSEYGSRLRDRPLEKAAPIILQALFEDLTTRFPKATVVIKRGDSEFLTWSSLYLANITICASSTFSFWPGMARTKTTYMPASSYIGGEQSKVYIHKSFHWIYNPKQFLNFTKDTSITDILLTLRQDINS